ncbi:MAG: hypothetical protein FWH48_00755 [Oscillospiraceae bacterium]|nr:hypothetical protein [Oscillospiraceae bacterium]
MQKNIGQWFSRSVLKQVAQYFVTMIAAVVLFYALFYVIFSGHFLEYIERTRGALTIPIILRDMVGIVCATIFPLLVPFVIVFGYLRSKRLYVPVAAAMLFFPLLPLVCIDFLYFPYVFGMSIAYLLTIILGILLAVFFRLFMRTSEKVEIKLPDITIFLLKSLILSAICFVGFIASYWIFHLFSVVHSTPYFYTPYSWDLPPIGPYYIFSFVIVFPVFLGTNKKHMIYSLAMILLLSLLLLVSTEPFSYEITELYMMETFNIIWLIEDFFSKWRHSGILLLLLMFFSSSFLFVLIYGTIKNRHKKNPKWL